MENETVRLRLLGSCLIGSRVRLPDEIVDTSADRAEALFEAGLAVFANPLADTPSPEVIRERRAARHAALTMS